MIGRSITWCNWLILDLPVLVSILSAGHNSINSQPIYMIRLVLSSHGCRLQSAPWTGTWPAGLSLGAIGEHLIYQLLYQFFRQAITSSILNQFTWSDWHWVPTVASYNLYLELANDRPVYHLVQLVNTWSTSSCMNSFGRPSLHQFSTDLHDQTDIVFP